MPLAGISFVDLAAVGTIRSTRDAAPERIYASADRARRCSRSTAMARAPSLRHRSRRRWRPSARIDVGDATRRRRDRRGARRRDRGAGRLEETRRQVAREAPPRRGERHRGGEPRLVRRADGPGDGQALSRGDRRDRQLRRRLPLLRRDGARRGRQDRRHHPGRLVPVCPLRALRRQRPPAAVQFPDPAHVLDGRRVARRRQRRDRQAGRGDDAVDARIHEGVPLASARPRLLPSRRRGHGTGADRARTAPMPSPSPARSPPARPSPSPAPSG